MHPVYQTMIIAWLVVGVWVGLVIFSQRKYHPRALFLLFFAELWERFSYYGMRALLFLYMTKSLAFSDNEAYGIYAAYGAMVYATPILGGLIAEKLFGYRKAILWGGILMALGHFAMAFEQVEIFYSALALLILGNGFFKPNISSFVGKFYEQGDPRRDGAFTIFYMGINVGAFLTPLTCGAIGELEGWHYGFGLAGIGMVVGLLVFVWGLGANVFEDKGLPPNVEALKKPLVPGITNEVAVYLGTFLAVPLVYLLINRNEILDGLLIVLGIAMIGTLLYISFSQDTEAGKQRIWVIVTLLLFTSMFWTFFELAGSAINAFTDRNVDRTLMGNEVPASIFQSVNPGFIILLAPAFSWLWSFLDKVKLNPPAPVKFSIGLILLGAGFYAFVIGEGFAQDGMVPVIFLILAYLLHTLGELCLSPVGLSLVTKLSPKEIVGFIMGIWFLSSSIAHQAGKFIAQMTSGGEGAETASMAPAESLSIYVDVFGNVGMVAIGAGVFLLLISPILTRWMHGIK